MENAQDEPAFFSETHPEAVCSLKTRNEKAATIVRVLQDYFGQDMGRSSVLDVGCSTGIIDGFLSQHVQAVYGIDTDKPAIRHAKMHFDQHHARFHVGSATDIPFADNRFDIVICAHVYEHVSLP